jgi:hypothetical protein
LKNIFVVLNNFFHIAFGTGSLGIEKSVTKLSSELAVVHNEGQNYRPIYMPICIRITKARKSKSVVEKFGITKWPVF